MKAVLLCTLTLLASGCASYELVWFEKCAPTYGVGGLVYMNSPCIGWSDGVQVARDKERVLNGPYAPRKVLMIYRNDHFIEAIKFD